MERIMKIGESRRSGAWWPRRECGRIVGAVLVVGSLMAQPMGLSAAESISPLELAKKLNQAFVQVAERVSPSVVVIDVASSEQGRFDPEDHPFFEFLPEEKQEELRKRMEEESESPGGSRDRYDGRGSGVIIRENGFILTNRHVVQEAERIRVRLKDGREFDAEVHGKDPQSDLAVVKIEASGLKAAKLADSAKVRVGEFAIALGAPFQLDYSLTVGHVSAKGRSEVIPLGAGGAVMDQNFIQTDANINPGNSGGPLLNIEGEVIGINSVIRGLDTGIGFAIASNLASEVATKLIEEGEYRRAWLGISIRSLADDRLVRQQVEQTDEGVVVRGISDNGPASKSELERFDVIVAVDGVTVSTAQELKAQVRRKTAGKPMTLKVVRVGREGPLDIEVVPETWPERLISRMAPLQESERTVSMGITVEKLTPDIAEENGVEAGQGIMVAEVEEGSEAAKKGIKAGDIITKVNDKPIESPEAFKETVTDADEKAGIRVTLVNDGSERVVELTKDEDD